MGPPPIRKEDIMAVEQLSKGNDEGTVLGQSATDKISFYGVTPVVQAATNAAAPAGGTGATEGAYDTSTNRNSLITLVNAMRTTLINAGLMASA